MVMVIKIIDNILESMQDEDMVTMED